MIFRCVWLNQPQISQLSQEIYDPPDSMQSSRWWDAPCSDLNRSIILLAALRNTVPSSRGAISDLKLWVIVWYEFSQLAVAGLKCFHWKPADASKAGETWIEMNHSFINTYKTRVEKCRSELSLGSICTTRLLYADILHLWVIRDSHSKQLLWLLKFVTTFPSNRMSLRYFVWNCHILFNRFFNRNDIFVSKQKSLVCMDMMWLNF